MSSAGVLSKEVVKQLRNKFYSENRNILAQNACVKVDPNEIALSRRQVELTNNVFTNKVDPEGKPFTNQKETGRCWLFAALNMMRIPFMKHYNIEDIEFSQSYLFFWDKLERSNKFLHNIAETARKGEKVDGRLVSFLLKDPMEDGGQWDMLTNLINRYGVIPKSCFPESYSSEHSMRMNSLLRSKLREFAMEIRNFIESGASNEQVEAKILEQMTIIYRVISICLGCPPETITYEYYDKSKAYHKIGPITGLEFYEKYVKPCINLDDKVCLTSDPRPTNPFGKLYTVEYLNNMVGGRLVQYNNQPTELLIKLCAETIKNNEPVWFGCEVSKRGHAKLGLYDNKLYDYKTAFGTDFQINMTKAERLLYGESAMQHAMVFTAVSFDEAGKPTKFRIENTWGDDRGDKGYFQCTSEWFHEFVFEAVIDKKYVPDDVLAVFNQEPIVLPAWDPMGCLAR